MTKIVVKYNFPAIHCWANCPIPEVEFLKFPHRHIFHITVKLPVNHDDRDLEFLMIKNELHKIINKLYPIMNGSDNVRQLGSRSCEMIAKEIMQAFSKKGFNLTNSYISVFEDDENGAEVTIDTFESLYW